MRSDTYETRLLIMRTAERLFCERGVDCVSMLEIQEAAGQRNHSAVKYHFGDCRGLVEAILERHSSLIQARWMLELDALEAAGAPTLRQLITILTHGMASKLDDEDGGRQYLELCAQLVAHPQMPIQTMLVRAAAAPVRLGLAVVRLTAIPVELRVLRGHRFIHLLLTSLADRARDERRGAPTTPRALVVADLIDALLLVLDSTPSAETLALLSSSAASSEPAAAPTSAPRAPT